MICHGIPLPSCHCANHGAHALRGSSEDSEDDQGLLSLLGRICGLAGPLFETDWQQCQGVPGQTFRSELRFKVMSSMKTPSL